MLKKLISIILTLITAISLTGYIDVKAIEVENSNSIEEKIRQLNEYDLLIQIENLMKKALISNEIELLDTNNGDKGYKIDVSDAIESESDFSKISNVIKFSPYLSYTLESISINRLTQTQGNEKKYYIEVSSNKDNQYFIDAFNKVSKKLSEITSLVTDNMTDVEKLLVIHDYLILNGEYDEDIYNKYLANEDVSNSKSFTSAGIIMNDVGVCDSYANAYMYIMNLVGVDCYYVSGQLVNEIAVDHAWNLVNVEGKYYYVDCTSDDPVPDQFGLVNHVKFLIGLNELTDTSASSYYTNVINPSDIDEKYISLTNYNDDYKYIVSPVCLDSNNNWYYIINKNDSNGKYINQIVKKINNEITALKNYSYDDLWKKFNSNKYYVNTYSGLFLFDNELFYNTSTEIRKYSLIDGEDTLVYQIDGNDKYIYGIKLNEGQINYILKDDPVSTDNVKDTILVTNEEKEYTISYQNMDNITNSNPSVYTTNQGIVLRSPTRNYYTFDGWYSDKNLNNKVTVISKGTTGDITLYAKWTAIEYSITYEGIDDTAKLNYPVSYNIENVRDVCEKIYATVPTKNGYTLVDWYLDSNYQNSLTSLKSCGNITLYAKWKENIKSYEINYNLDGGTNSTSNPTSYKTNDKITLQNPTKAGYDFAGWYLNNTTKISTIQNMTGSITLYAKWTPKTYSITYNLNGGTNNNNPTTYTIESTITLNNPTRVGYTFSGWYSDSALTTPVISISGNVTLYAKWTPINYSISYSLNGGKNSSNPTTYTIESIITLKNPTRVGYTFSGWYSDSKFKNKVITITKNNTGNKTLYAKWTKITVAKVSTPTLKNEKGNKLKITFKAIKNVKEYEIQYSTDKNFKKSVKTIKTTKTTTTVKLTKNKTYYVRVRAKSTTLDSTKKSVYGSYSSIKSLKITK